MKRSLKLRKIKISKVNNIMAGALPAHGAAQDDKYDLITYDARCTYTKDVNADTICSPGTNNGSIRTIGAPAEPVNSGIQN